jgi:hypothetical protein
MDIKRLQGFALLLILPIDLIVLIGGDSPLFATLSLVTVVLFILGIPAVSSSQSLGTAGLVGIIAVELAAIIALSINLMGGSVVSDLLPLTSVLAGALGRIILGWLTVQRKVFPAWVGWAFLAQGVLNLAGFIYFYDLESIGPALGAAAFLLEDISLFGFGLAITQRKS